MRRSHQVHAVSIAIICAVIIVLYMLIGPKSTDSHGEIITGDRFIQVYSATWGENCNSAINQSIRDRQSVPLKKDANGIVIASEAPAPVTTNNVLTQVSTQCDNHLTCQMDVTSTALGVEPISTCYKKLTLSYRCFSYDRLWNLELKQGEKLKLDCNATAPAAAK